MLSGGALSQASNLGLGVRQSIDQMRLVPPSVHRSRPFLP